MKHILRNKRLGSYGKSVRKTVLSYNMSPDSVESTIQRLLFCCETRCDLNSLINLIFSVFVYGTELDVIPDLL